MRSQTLQSLTVIIIVTFLLLAMLPFSEAMSIPQQTDIQDPLRIMAYYYIWFDPSSWNRAKTDFPVLGRYSSGSQEVMTQHVQWAKEAGIDGFIVSWKSTPQLDQRLLQLMDIVTEENFNLWIIYQGLDFDRAPLLLNQIDSDFEFFIENFADHPAFDMYDRPIVIWSGTWEFSQQEIFSITSVYGDELMILASERNTEGYERLAHLVDGNAYYWSSVNPSTFTGYQEKLDDMSRAVHERGGLWIAPAAPGFDAREIGGTRIVERNDGDTLRREMNAAIRSSPDAIGLISWNEFSENTHVEPSQNYGTRALEVLADRELTFVPQLIDFDSSAPGTTDTNSIHTLYILLGTILLVGIGFLGIILRRPQQKAGF